MIFLRLESYVAIELLAYLLWDDEAQSYSLGVHLLLVLNEAEEFEELFMVFLWDTDACIYHLYLEVSFQFLADYLYPDDNFSLLSELESVCLEA